MPEDKESLVLELCPDKRQKAEKEARTLMGNVRGLLGPEEGAKNTMSKLVGVEIFTFSCGAPVGEQAPDGSRRGRRDTQEASWGLAKGVGWRHGTAGRGALGGSVWGKGRWVPVSLLGGCRVEGLKFGTRCGTQRCCAPRVGPRGRASAPLLLSRMEIKQMFARLVGVPDLCMSGALCVA